MAEGSIRAYAAQRASRYGARKTFQPGPHKGGYITEQRSQELKGRQFGPGPRPGIGAKTPLIK